MIRSVVTTIGLMSAILGAGSTDPAGAADTQNVFTPDVVVERPASKGGYGLSQILSIGGPDAEDPAQFYERLGSVLVSADGRGNIYVLDNGNNRVQVFDSQGSFLHGFGAEGEGPGEFKMPSRFSVNAAGDCAVFDMAQQRISIFDADGNLKRDQVTTGMVRDIALDDDGSLYVAYEQNRPAALVHYDVDGAEAWTFGKPAPRRGGEIQMIKVMSGVSAPALAIAGDRTFQASDDAYCVRPVTRDGSARPAFARTYERQKMELPQRRNDDDDEEGGMVFISVERTADGGGGEHGGGGGGGVKTEVSVGDHGDGEWHIDTDDLKNYMPEFSPDINGLLSWPDGRIWVMTSQGDDDTMVVDEWSIDGEFLKSFELDGEYAVLRVGADGALYGVAHDEDDYPIVYRLEVSKAM